MSAVAFLSPLRGGSSPCDDKTHGLRRGAEFFRRFAAGRRGGCYYLNLGSGDAADQVFLLLLAFGADGEGVEYP